MTQHGLEDLAQLRLSSVLELVQVSKSTWYRGVKSGIYPKPIKIGRMSRYQKADIRKVLLNPNRQQF
jgi:predicted DNA-binding transcriptional regulator AlpA